MVFVVISAVWLGVGWVLVLFWWSVFCRVGFCGVCLVGGCVWLVCVFGVVFGVWVSVGVCVFVGFWWVLVGFGGF